MDAELFSLLHNPKTTSILVMSTVVGELHVPAGEGLPSIEMKPSTVYNLLDFNTRALEIIQTHFTNLDFLSALTSILPDVTEDFAVAIIQNNSMTDVSKLLDTIIVGGDTAQAAFIDNSTLPGVAQCDAVLDHWVAEGFTGPISQQGNGPG